MGTPQAWHLQNIPAAGEHRVVGRYRGVLTYAWMVAHCLPIDGPCGRIVYFPTAAGTMNVSA